MLDVERITNANQARRQWADDIAAQEAETRKRKQISPEAQKLDAARREAVRALYIVTGACAGSAGCFAAAGLLGSHIAWTSLIVSVVIGLIALVSAVALDKEVE